MDSIFRRLAAFAAEIVGSAPAFALAATIVLVWAITGPVFQFSDTWQLVINTATTIVTFLMVFLIQNTQNRDTRALHAKLDELILYTQGASNRLVGAEQLSEQEIRTIQEHLLEIAKRQPDTQTPRRTKQRT